MDYKSWYRSHFESRLMGRYVCLKHLNEILNDSTDYVEISNVGHSELGKDIQLLKIGHGKIVILAWSQMHGNESTTTKAIFDFLKFIGQKHYFQTEIKQFLDRFSFYIIPMLNPDGSELYTRENANLVDLNRDAKDLTQSESQVLKTVFNDLEPDLCLNLHDQRSIYGLENELSATVSFLAPSADKERSITPSRKLAMEHIVRMNSTLQNIIPGNVGRYDDAFNENCVGDTFQLKGVPTILFEAGHYKEDYGREKTREFIFLSFLTLFEINDESNIKVDYQKYFEIPENKINFKDLILRNVKLLESDKSTDIAIQFTEVLKDESISFDAIVDSIKFKGRFNGHLEIDMRGENVLINSQEKIAVGQKISTIARKSDPSVIIFPKQWHLTE